MQLLHRATAPPAESGGREDRLRAWRWASGVLSIGILAVLAVLWETAWSMASTWWESPAFSHGFLIIPISGYLIWQQRARLAALTPKPAILGLGGLAALGAALVWLTGEVAAVQLVQQLALVAILQALFIAVLGLRVAAVILFPLFYLFFGVPVGSFLIVPLQDVTAAFVVRALQTIGMPVYLDGIFIHIPSGSFEVAEACAGLRFLISSVAIGVIFAYVFYRQAWRRILFVALSIVVPIVANGFRATGLVLLAHHSGYQLAVGVDHITYGLIFLSLVLFCLFGIGYSFREPPRALADKGPADDLSANSGNDTGPMRVGSPYRLSGAAAGVVAIVAASAAYATQIEARGTDSRIAPAPPAIGDWQATAPAHADWHPLIPNTSQDLMWGYSDGTRHVDLYVAYFAQQRQDAEVVNWMNNLVGEEVWQRAGSGTTTVTLAGQEVLANYVRIVAGDRERFVWYWYRVDGHTTGNAYLAKLLEVKAKLLGGDQAAAVVALATDSAGDPKAANSALTHFAAQAWPFTQVFERPKP